MKKSKKIFGIREEYKKSWKYLRDSKSFIYIATGIFFLFVLIGFFMPAPEFIYDKIMTYIRELLKQTEGMSLFQLIWFILSNNVKSTVFAVIFGVFFGIYPLATSIVNGYILGFVSAVSVSGAGIASLWRLLPHGIFELPAVFISLGLGVKLGTFIFQKDKIKSLKNYMINSIRVFGLIIVPLLIIAGIIEAVILFFVK
jgi:stage II sporulation protein M